MENKMTIAVLLSLMAVAGLAVTDAYAQSNTQRIATIDDNTEDIKGIVEDISDSVGSLVSMISTVQTTLTELATTVQGMVASIAGIQASVDDVAIDVSLMSSKISTMDSALSGITAIDARLTTIGDSIDSLKTSMNYVSTSDSEGTTAALGAVNSRIEATNSRINDIFKRLASIESSLTIASQETITDVPSRNALLGDKTDLEVGSYDYIRYGDSVQDRGDPYYELDMVFSCNKNVFLDQVDLYDATDDNEDYLDRTTSGEDPDKDTNNNYVRVDGRDLYNNAFPISDTDFAKIDLPLDFGNKLLRAGETLKFTSKIYDGTFNNGTVDSTQRGVFDTDDDNDDERKLFAHTNKNKNTHIRLYEIDVHWVASETGVSCSLNFGGAGTSTPGLTSSDTLKYGVTTDKADRNSSLKDFRDAIYCNGEPIEINRIEVGTTDDWKLPSFVKVKLKIGSEEYLLEFPDNEASGPIIENHDDIVPLAVGNQDFEIYGSIPLNNLLISIQYDTIPGNKCTEVPHEPYK